jgi:hypothetical protein
MLNDVVSLLSHAIQFIGQAIVVFGLIGVGITFADGMNGSGAKLYGAIAMIIGGFLLTAYAKLFNPSF